MPEQPGRPILLFILCAHVDQEEVRPVQYPCFISFPIAILVFKLHVLACQGKTGQIFEVPQGLQLQMLSVNRCPHQQGVPLRYYLCNLHHKQSRMLKLRLPRGEQTPDCE